MTYFKDLFIIIIHFLETKNGTIFIYMGTRNDIDPPTFKKM